VNTLAGKTFFFFFAPQPPRSLREIRQRQNVAKKTKLFQRKGTTRQPQACLEKINHGFPGLHGWGFFIRVIPCDPWSVLLDPRGQAFSLGKVHAQNSFKLTMEMERAREGVGNREGVGS
jgi:hypothetical protein